MVLLFNCSQTKICKWMQKEEFSIMRTIYLVRHGQTLFNVHHKIQGTCDSPLTSLGVAQAKAVNHFFVNQGVKFDCAFCSTQERASDTLEIITDHKIKYTRLKNLREKSHGEYEGADEFMLPWRQGQSRITPLMESDQHVEQRMEAAMTEILDQSRNDDTILIVRHGTAMRLFTRTINPNFDQYDNCGVVKLQAHDDKIKFCDYYTPAANVNDDNEYKDELLKVR